MSKFIAPMSMTNSIPIDTSETLITLTVLIKSAKILQIFWCINAMHTSVFSLFLALHPGMLQTLPLKINFILEVWTLLRLGWAYPWYPLVRNSTSNWLDIEDIPSFRVPPWILFVWLWTIITGINPTLSSNILRESNSLRHLILLSFTSYFGEVPILGYQPSTLGLVMVHKIRFHGAHNDT
jgi:hypothetical protein